MHTSPNPDASGESRLGLGSAHLDEPQALADPNRGPTVDTRLGVSTRMVLVFIALSVIVVFMIARWLDPDPSGRGTHRQLGLPVCHFYWVTGTPCPTCGMTTAFAWFVRGGFDQSFRANPAGLFLAAGSLVLIPWLLAGAALGRPVGFRSLEWPMVVLVACTIALSLVSWTIRLFFKFL